MNVFLLDALFGTEAEDTIQSGFIRGDRRPSAARSPYSAYSRVQARGRWARSRDTSQIPLRRLLCLLPRKVAQHLSGYGWHNMMWKVADALDHPDRRPRMLLPKAIDMPGRLNYAVLRTEQDVQWKIAGQLRLKFHVFVEGPQLVSHCFNCARINHMSGGQYRQLGRQRVWKGRRSQNTLEKKRCPSADYVLADQ